MAVNSDSVDKRAQAMGHSLADVGQQIVGRISFANGERYSFTDPQEYIAAVQLNKRNWRMPSSHGSGQRRSAKKRPVPAAGDGPEDGRRSQQGGQTGQPLEGERKELKISQTALAARAGLSRKGRPGQGRLGKMVNSATAATYPMNAQVTVVWKMGLYACFVVRPVVFRARIMPAQ